MGHVSKEQTGYGWGVVQWRRFANSEQHLHGHWNISPEIPLRMGVPLVTSFPCWIADCWDAMQFRIGGYHIISNIVPDHNANLSSCMTSFHPEWDILGEDEFLPMHMPLGCVGEPIILEYICSSTSG